MCKKNLLVLSVLATFFFAACSGGKTESSSEANDEVEATVADTDSYDPTRGEGSYDETNFNVGALDVALAEKGHAVSETKCFSCHKMSGEKLVGPGWKGVTERRTPHWIMNFITNPDPMIDKDPEVQAQLELCLVRMPNQNLAEEEAKSIVEFMRQNDGVK